jgi:hypothetical protein
VDSSTVQFFFFAGVAITTLGVTVRFYLRYRLKVRTTQAIAALISDAFLLGGPAGVRAVAPVADALVRNAALPALRTHHERIHRQPVSSSSTVGDAGQVAGEDGAHQATEER